MTRSVKAGCRFALLPNLSLWGEDRHFCVRAASLGFSLYADTHRPPLHLYRPTDLARVESWRGTWAGRDKEIRRARFLQAALRDYADAHHATFDGLGGLQHFHPDAAAALASAAGERAAQVAKHRMVTRADLIDGRHAVLRCTTGSLPTRDLVTISQEIEVGAAGVLKLTALAVRKVTEATVLDGPRVPFVRRSRGNRILLAMLVVAAGRHLHHALRKAATACDEILLVLFDPTEEVIEDCTQLLEGLAKPFQVVTVKDLPAHDEREGRTLLWQLAGLRRPDWVLVIEPYEILADGVADAVRSAVDQGTVDSVTFKVRSVLEEGSLAELDPEHALILVRWDPEESEAFGGPDGRCGRVPRAYELRARSRGSVVLAVDVLRHPPPADPRNAHVSTRPEPPDIGPTPFVLEALPGLPEGGPTLDHADVTARPGPDSVDGPLITCCVIVRDEAHNLPELFASTTGVVDEWVIVDTGSTDETVAVAMGLGARVFHFPWIDDFAAARNHALKQANGCWVLVLDADDRLHDGTALREHLKNEAALDVGQLLVESPLSPLPGAATDRGVQPRVFRRSCGVQYRFPVHELPVVDGLLRGTVPGRILHTGYQDEATRKQKAERILRLLPRVEDPVYRTYHECRALGTLGRHDDFITAAARFRELGVPVPPDVRTQLGALLVGRGAAGASIRLLVEGLETDPMHPDLYLGLWLAAGVGYVDRAERVLAGAAEGPPVATLSHLDAVADAIFATGLIEKPLRQAFAATLGKPPAGSPALTPGSGGIQTGEEHG